MKIFLYLKHFSPSGDELNEGTRKAVHGLALGLVNNNAIVSILCEGSKDSLVKSSFGYKIQCFSNVKSGEFSSIANSASFLIAPGIEPFIRKLDGNCLFVLNGIFHRSVYSVSRILKEYSIPYIVAPHDPYHPFIFKKNSHLKIPYWHLFEKRLLNDAVGIQVLDKRHGAWLKKRHVTTPFFETPNGFSSEDVILERDLEWRLSGRMRLFFLGRLDAYNKGLDLLLEAFSGLITTHDLELVFQGPDWGDRAALETQTSRLGISDRVTFLDPDYTQSPSAIIANYDIFCVPSRFEGFSLSALEAMLAGRVIVISDIAGLAPHVRASQCGEVVEPTVSSIANGLKRALEKRHLWQSIGLSGRHYTLKHLQWKAIGASAIEHYHRLLTQVV